MMDIHKETYAMQPCSELGRLFETEHNVKNLKEDVSEIKVSVNNLCSQLTELAKSMQSVIIKLDERDKASFESANLNKQTFERFGNKIELLDAGIHGVELQIAKSSNLECKVTSLDAKVTEFANIAQKTTTLEKVVYGAGSFVIVAMGTVMFWLIQKQVG
jgi:hypothetical protein